MAANESGRACERTVKGCRLGRHLVRHRQKANPCDEISLHEFTSAWKLDEGTLRPGSRDARCYVRTYHVRHLAPPLAMPQRLPYILNHMFSNKRPDLILRSPRSRTPRGVASGSSDEADASITDLPRRSS